MSSPYLGQVEFFAFTFAPKNWMMCAGQLLSIQQNQALFALLGTIYGGNGQTTFALPTCAVACRSAFPVRFPWERRFGEEQHTLVVAEIPAAWPRAQCGWDYDDRHHEHAGR